MPFWRNKPRPKEGLQEGHQEVHTLQVPAAGGAAAIAATATEVATVAITAATTTTAATATATTTTATPKALSLGLEVLKLLEPPAMASRRIRITKR